MCINQYYYIYQCYEDFNFHNLNLNYENTHTHDKNEKINDNNLRNIIHYIVIDDIYKLNNDETINHNKIICYINNDVIEYYNDHSNDNTLYKENNNNKNKTESSYDSVYITEIHNDLHNKSWIYKNIHKDTAKNIIKQALLHYPTEETLQNKIICQKNNIYELHKIYKNNNDIIQYGEKYIKSYIQEIQHKINIIHITTMLLEI